MPKFNWGEAVKIKASSPERFKVMTIGSVCGMRTIRSRDVAEQFDAPIGAQLYLLEREDGTTAEIPEIHLEAV